LKTEKTWTVLSLIQWTKEYFESRKVEPARRQAEDLLGMVLELDRLHLYLQFEYQPTASELALFRNLVQRRAEGEPLQYLLGWQPFLGLKIKTDRRALIPRPETETLGQMLLESFKSREDLRIADLGTGTGCLALGLCRLPGSQVWATDCSPEALSLARENAAALELEGNLQFLQGSWFVPLGQAGVGDLDLAVSNPPYITAGDAAALPREVRGFEPAGALIAGPDGREALREILQQAPSYLRAGGLLALECGAGQAEGLKIEALEGNGWKEARVEKDSCGIGRYLMAWKA
jgi:release factor glutamine methyltransferase